MDNDNLEDNRAFRWGNYHRLWIQAKAGDYNDVTDEEKHIMKIMLDHEDEYSDLFERADFLDDFEFDPETKDNPFLHLTLHSIVEGQLEKRQPPGAYQFYLAMLNMNCPRHEVIHLMGAIYSKLLFPYLLFGEPFDNKKYEQLLKKYINKKPKEIWKILNESGESRKYKFPVGDHNTPQNF